jgi:hypothetical protein
LESLGALAEPALRKALEVKPSPEMRRTIESLLEKLAATPSGDHLRALRVIEVLERIGTAEARQFLQTLASGAQAAPLTGEAKAAVDRLTSRH